MRTTLTLDDDVAIGLQKLIAERKEPLRSVVNVALRAGLATLAERKPLQQTQYATVPVRLGQLRLPNLDNIAEILALAEGEDHP
ncbi:MAG: DUF2191 domain-containing protein [Candidatus Schekmanbacteria bacterium]|nr:DUF2191 domain-containing protein [Candidatus Schekmanbacteria bacterium]